MTNQQPTTPTVGGLEQTMAAYYCKEGEHAWVYIHEPRSIPTDYNKCSICVVIDASETIAQAVEEALIVELANIPETRNEYGLRSYIKDRIKAIKGDN